MISVVSLNSNKITAKSELKRNEKFSHKEEGSIGASYSKPSAKLLKAYYLNKPFQNNVNFKAIKMLSIADEFKPLEKTLHKESEQFVEVGDNARLIGQGLFSKAYELTDFPNIIIKMSKITDNYSDEEKHMRGLPATIQGSQRFVARVYDDCKNKYYILSTKVKGESANPSSHPWTPIHLQNLFDGMFEMDKHGFYHGDLNNGNVKLEKDTGKVNFLDYQWASETSQSRFFENKKDINLPNFMPVQNSQMFEMAEIPYYLKQINNPAEGKKFFKNYLQAKSTYHRKRVDFIQNITKNWQWSGEVPYINKAVDFEKAQARLFENPSENILKAETLKVQFLSSFREAFKHIDEKRLDKNIIPAGSAYLVALSDVQRFRKEIHKQIDGVSRGTYTEDYLNSQKEFGEYWFDNLKEWTKDAFGFPYRHTALALQSWEKLHDFNQPNVNIEHFESIPNIINLIDPQYVDDYTRNFSFRTSDINENIKDLDSIVNSNKYSSNGEKSQTVADKHDAFLKTSEKVKKSYENGWGLDVINSSLLATLRARELQSESWQTIYYKTLSGNEGEFVKKSMEQGAHSSSKFSKIAYNTFHNIYNDIINNGPSSLTFPGYKNMSNLNID